MTAVYICECGHPKSQHKRERDGCRAPECAGACAKSEVDLKASAEVQGVTRAGTIPPGTIVRAATMEPVGVRLEVLCAVEKERDELAAQLAATEQTRDRISETATAAQHALIARNAELAEAYGLVEQIPGRTPIEVLRQLIGDGQDARTELAHLREVVEMRCGHCVGLGLIPAENFGRDADGAPWTDDEQPCPDGCEIPSWLAGERNDAADDRRLLAEAQRDLERVRGQLTDVRAAAAEKVRAVLDASSRPSPPVIAEHVRYLCETCGSRYGQPYTDHEHGPLTPVTVTIARQGAPTA